MRSAQGRSCDAAGVHGVRELAPAIDSPRNPREARTAGWPAPKPGSTRNRGLSSESGSKLPQSKAASPRWRDCDAAGVHGVRELAPAIDSPREFQGARTAGWCSRRSPGARAIEASPRKAAASYRSPKRLRRGGVTATPQASLECGSLLPLSIRPGIPGRLARPGGPPPKSGSTRNRGLSSESGSKLPQSKAASPRWA